MDMDEDTLLHFQCEIELTVVGLTQERADKRGAAALRALADRIEKGEFESGHHLWKDISGTSFGKIYVDYSESPT